MPNVVDERIKRWKNKLIDLSKRNRLLNFKPTKVSTIRIVDEIPAEVFRTLVIENQKMKFLPVADEDEEQEALFPEEKKKSLPKIDVSTKEFKIYKKEELPQRHVDLFLQTNLIDKRLEKNLFRIASISKSVMEEQGYNALFLALGFLEWFESQDSDIKFKSPIILIPVELMRKSVKNEFVLSFTEEPPILNPALVHKLELSFGINIEEIAEDLEGIETQAIFTKIKKNIENYNRWKVTNDIALGLFSFNKFIMFKDLDVNIKTVQDNLVIKTLCGIQQERNISLNQICPMEEIENRTNPAKTFQILDADSSQQRAILAIKQGHNLIIEGPPGTGKSQTIANIIAESLMEGKKALFVSQKMAALEVVKKRLDATGLGDYCLELHSRKTNKRKVSEELGKVMHQRKKPDHAHDRDLVKLESLRNQLNLYVKELHKPFGKLGTTPYKAIGILNLHPNVKDLAFLFSYVEDWDSDKFDVCIELMDKLSRNLLNIGNPFSHSWNGSRLTELSYSSRLQLIECLNSILKRIKELKGPLEKLNKICSYVEVNSIEDIVSLVDVAGILSDSPNPPKDILKNRRWNSISSEIEDIIKTVSKFNDLEKEVSEFYNMKIIEQDTDFLLERYRRYSKNGFFFLMPSFWKCSKILKMNFTKKRKISFKGLVADLEKICDTRQTALKIDKSEALGKELFGSIWKGRKTVSGEVDTHGHARGTFKIQASLDLNPGVLAISHRPKLSPHPNLSWRQNTPVTIQYFLSNTPSPTT